MSLFTTEPSSLNSNKITEEKEKQPINLQDEPINHRGEGNFLLTDDKYKNLFSTDSKTDPIPVKKQSFQPLDYRTLKTNYGVTDFENNKEVIRDAEKVLGYFGSNDEIVEWLRDAEISTTSLVARALKSKNAPDEIKSAYARLQNNFRKAKLKNPTEWIGLLKNGFVDVMADPLTLVSLMAAPFTAGTSLAARTALNQAIKQGLKRYSMSEATKLAARPAILTGAEGAAWSGLHNYYNQDLDINLGLRNNLDLNELITATTAGGVIGGGLGFVSGALDGRRYFKKQYIMHNPDAQIKIADSKTRKQVVETEQAYDAILPTQRSPRVLVERAIGTFVGKATTPLLTTAKSSKTLDYFLRMLRYDYGRTTFGSGFKEKTDEAALSLSEGIALGFGKRHYPLEQIFNKLGRTSRFKNFFQARITEQDNAALLKLLQTRGTAKQFKYKEEVLDVSDEVKEAYKGVKKLLDDTFDEGVDEGIFRKQNKVKNYFPRIFSFGLLQANKDQFKDLLKAYGYATPVNTKPKKYKKYYNKLELDKKEGERTIELGIPADAKTIDQETFGLQEKYGVDSFEDLAILRKVKESEVAEKAIDLKADEIVENMLAMRHTPFEFRPTGSVGAGKGYMQHRVFTKIPDDELADFLETDVTDVLTDYFTSTTQTIERTKRFGLTNGEFEENIVQKIKQELNDNVPTNLTTEQKIQYSEDIEAVLEKVRNLHGKSTGLDVDRPTTLGGGKLQEISEWGRLSQQMAHLPLAVISSVTEPIIMLSRVGVTDVPAATAEIGKSLVKGIQKAVDRTIQGARSSITGKKVTFKDLDDDYWKELYEVGLALESATLDGFDRLASGDALTGKRAKGFQNMFFKMNFLTQWTQSVQAASFVTGQKIIRRNAQKLYEDSIGATTLSTGNFRNAGVNQKDYLTGQLNELGIDEQDAINWYRQSLNENKEFDVNLSQGLDFYSEKYLPGAGRFVNEVILNPSVAAANKPLMFSHPAGKLLFQFAGYPTAFNNIVMKRFVNESFKYPMSASPKVLGATLAMTSVAVLGNYLRSEGSSFVDYQTGRPKEFGEIIADAWARWGGFAFFDYGRRINQNFKYGSGTIGSIAKGVTGPLPADIVDTILYRKGLFSLGASNFPGYGALGLVDKDMQKNARKAGRDLDNKLAEFMFGEKKSSSSNRRVRYRTGGPSVNVPNAPARPEERVNKNTGMPYDLEAGPTAQPEKDRKGFSEEGKLLATLERRQKKFIGGVENLNDDSIPMPNPINRNDDSIPMPSLGKPPMSKDTVIDMVKDKSWFKRATEPEGELYKGKHTLLTTSMEADGKEYLFPTIREVNGKLKKLSNKDAFKEAMSKKDFLVFEGKDKREQATEVSKIISNLIMPTRDTRMKKVTGGVGATVESLINKKSDEPVRYNNPGNIEEGQGYAGETGNVYNEKRRKEGMKAFVVFDTPEAGIRAIMRDTRNKIKNSKGDLKAMIYRYAPPSDKNPTEKYYNFVLGMVNNKKIVTEEDIPNIVRGIIKFENTKELADFYLQPEIFNKAIAISKQDFPEGTTTQQMLEAVNYYKRQKFDSGGDAEEKINLNFKERAKNINETYKDKPFHKNIDFDLLRDIGKNPVSSYKFGDRYALGKNNERIALPDSAIRFANVYFNAAKALGYSDNQALAITTSAAQETGYGAKTGANSFGIKARKGEPYKEVITHEENAEGRKKETHKFYDLSNGTVQDNIQLFTQTMEREYPSYWKSLDTEPYSKAIKYLQDINRGGYRKVGTGYATDKNYLKNLDAVHKGVKERIGYFNDTL